MPLLVLLRLLTGLFGWAVLAAIAYLAWTGWQGEWVTGPDGEAVRVREDWRIWTALGLVAWSLLGRVFTPLLAKPEKGRVSRPVREEGRLIPSPSGASLWVESLGRKDGPVLVLTHGWGLDSTIWNSLTAVLQQRFGIIRWDLPGLGRSKTAPDGVVTLERMAQDLASVVDIAGQRPVILVGHSIGGMTIQTLARDQPAWLTGRAAGVVLLNTTHTNPLKTMIASGLAQALRWPLLEPALRLAIWLQPLAWLSAWQGYANGTAHLANRAGFGRLVTRSQLEHTTLLAVRNPPGVQAKGDLAMFRWDAGSGPAHLTLPLLVITSDRDIVTRPDASGRIAGAAPSAELISVEGANHMGPLEAANAYAEAITRFVTRLEERPSDRTPRALAS